MSLLSSPLLDISGDVGADSGVIAGRVIVTVIIVVVATTLWDMFLALRRLRQAGAE